MNINSTSGVSTLVPESFATARGSTAVTPASETGQSSGQNVARDEAPDRSGAASEPREIPVRTVSERPQLTDSWVSDEAVPDPAERVDIKV